jgi:hypothetical protein
VCAGQHTALQPEHRAFSPPSALPSTIT